jgi:hypothetical protein
MIGANFLTGSSPGANGDRQEREATGLDDIFYEII